MMIAQYPASRNIHFLWLKKRIKLNRQTFIEPNSKTLINQNYKVLKNVFVFTHFIKFAIFSTIKDSLINILLELELCYELKWHLRGVLNSISKMNILRKGKESHLSWFRETENHLQQWFGEVVLPLSHSVNDNSLNKK